MATVAVVAAVATFGVGAVLIGAAIGAACAVASTAVSDGLSGTKSSLGTYIKNALVGAVSGAIFGPFGTFGSLGGMMAFGGVTGMADSLLNQAVEGKFSLGQTLFDGLIGAATAGILHGMGKLISKVSPYIKTGMGKVLGKLSAGAKNILNKVSGTADNILGAFSKTSRELFEKAANKVGNVVTSIKNSAQDLADRICGKFNEVTSRIDNKIDDALRSVVNKADDALNSINKWVDKKVYDLSDGFGLVPEPVGGGKIPYEAPKNIKPVENLISKMSGRGSEGVDIINVNQSPSVESIINGEVKVPTNRQGFDEWFDSLTSDECNQLWECPSIKKIIKDRLRDGNNHEWYKVSNANVAKEWGLTTQEIKYDAVTEINTNNSNDLWFVDIEGGEGNIISGRHGDGKKAVESTHTTLENSASSYAHKELDNLFNTSGNNDDYLRSLNEWADSHLNSRYALKSNEIYNYHTNFCMVSVVGNFDTKLNMVYASFTRIIMSLLFSHTSEQCFVYDIRSKQAIDKEIYMKTFDNMKSWYEKNEEIFPVDWYVNYVIYENEGKFNGITLGFETFNDYEIEIHNKELSVEELLKVIKYIVINVISRQDKIKNRDLISILINGNYDEAVVKQVESKVLYKKTLVVIF
ncbi:hypothetical protein FDA52_02390 [Clostridium botulinum]|nr:hypothetical protein [Clostridium botulinum]